VLVVDSFLAGHEWPAYRHEVANATENSTMTLAAIGERVRKSAIVDCPFLN